MRRLLIICFFIFTIPTVKAADLVIAINTLECENYYRSAVLLTDLQKNFNIKFIFPEYESRLAVKYLNEKFNLHWQSYEIIYNDSLYKSYRKNSISECVYFPDNAKTPLISFPLSQLDYSYPILQSIPGKIKMDTIPVNNEFLFSGAMSCSFDSNYIYILEEQFGSLLRLNKNDNTHKIYQLPEFFTYEKIKKRVLTDVELSTSDSILKTLTDPRTLIPQIVSFTKISAYGNDTYIKASISYYKIGNENKIGIFTRNFVIKTSNMELNNSQTFIIPSTKGITNGFGPVFVSNDTICMSVHIYPSMNLPLNEKFILGQYVMKGNELEFTGFEKKVFLPEEHSRLNLNYNFLGQYCYQNYFSFPYTKTIYNVNGTSFKIELLPEIDTLPGSKIPEVKTNYMKMAFAVQYPVTNFITKFDNGKVKLFSYDYQHNLPFNQVELPIQIKTAWPDEDFFAFTSINSFIHINLRNQYIVKYSWSNI